MLIHNVECVDYNTNEEHSLDALLEGIQIVLLPVGLSMYTRRTKIKRDEDERL
jgi:hypothetical protein